MLWGEREIDMFLAATGLKNANTSRLPTYPSKNPRRHLDFVLHSKEIKIRNFQVPLVSFSDHLPVVVDFDVEVDQNRRKIQRPSHCSCSKFSAFSGSAPSAELIARQAPIAPTFFHRLSDQQKVLTADFHGHNRL